VLEKFKVVMQFWLAAIIAELVAVSDEATFETAVGSALQWEVIGDRLGLLSKAWYLLGDPLDVEGMYLKSTALLAFERVFQAAHEECRRTGDIQSLLRLIRLDTAGYELGLIDSRLSSIMSPTNFCLKFEIVSIDRPPTLPEGDSARISFIVQSANPGVFLTASDLKALGVVGKIIVRSPSLFEVGMDTVPANGFLSRVETVATGLRALDGRTDEGTVQLEVHLQSQSGIYATATTVVDVVPDETTITCSGSPGTTTDAIAILFDGATSCRIVTSWADVEPEQMLELDADEDESTWDDDGFGPNWMRTELGQNVATGTHVIRLTHVATGATFDLHFTVDVAIGSETRLTVRDVSVTPLP
jgi:hypothetical protein